jgi:hypothetical protein
VNGEPENMLQPTQIGNLNKMSIFFHLFQSELKNSYCPAVWYDIYTNGFIPVTYSRDQDVTISSHHSALSSLKTVNTKKM